MDIHYLTRLQLESVRDRLIDRHRTLLAHPAWISTSVKDGIRAFILHPDDGKISIVRAESTLPCSAQKLFDYLVTDIDSTCSEWNDVMLYSGRIKDYGDGFELSRIISEGGMVADREDVFLRCTGKFSNGNIYEVSEGYGTDQEPVYKGISRYTVRSEMYFASKEILPVDDGHCLYKTIWHYDPAGWLSKLMPRKLLGKAILKNLVHEHRKLKGIFSGRSGNSRT